MTLRFLLYLVALLTLFSCRQGPQENAAAIDPVAKELNDSAVALYVTRQEANMEVAIDLLDRATEIDPDYYLAHWNKLVFLNELNRKDEALETIQTLESLSPENPELKTASGILHENKGDRQTALEKYQRAHELYRVVLDTLTREDQLSMVHANKALNMLLLGQEKEAREIFQVLYDQEQDSLIKELLQEYQTLSRQDVLDGRVNRTNGDS